MSKNQHQEVKGDGSDFKCPKCGTLLFDPGDGFPEENDVLECGNDCGTKVKVTSVDWSVYFTGEVVA